MVLRYIVCLLLCVSKFNAQENELPPVYKDYISSGNDAAPGQFPYLVGLYGPRGHFCGASIISPNFVLSAAHCFYDRPTNNPSVVKVYAGSTYINSGYRYDVRQIKLYPGYPVRNKYDVAVLNTLQTIRFNDAVQPITLAFRRVIDGPCIVSGWGLLGYQGSSSKPEILQYSVEQAIDLAQCRRAWPDVNQSNICTRRIGDQGPRPGDSGGCLSIHTDQGFRQVGIVSRSAPGLPYIFTSVAFDRNWIVQATNNLS